MPALPPYVFIHLLICFSHLGSVVFQSEQYCAGDYASNSTHQVLPCWLKLFTGEKMVHANLPFFLHLLISFFLHALCSEWVVAIVNKNFTSIFSGTIYYLHFVFTCVKQVSGNAFRVDLLSVIVCFCLHISVICNRWIKSLYETFVLFGMILCGLYNLTSYEYTSNVSQTVLECLGFYSETAKA